MSQQIELQIRSFISCLINRLEKWRFDVRVRTRGQGTVLQAVPAANFESAGVRPPRGFGGTGHRGLSPRMTDYINEDCFMLQPDNKLLKFIDVFDPTCFLIVYYCAYCDVTQSFLIIVTSAIQGGQRLCRMEPFKRPSIWGSKLMSVIRKKIIQNMQLRFISWQISALAYRGVRTCNARAPLVKWH